MIILIGFVNFVSLAREAKNCVHRGKTYRDGNYFRPDCSEICLCQNGQVTCSTSCPHEFRRPSPHNCRQPHLVAIAGRCCKEWVCPHVHSLPEPCKYKIHGSCRYSQKYYGLVSVRAKHVCLQLKHQKSRALLV